LKLEQSLPCSFYHINSTKHFGVKPVWLDRAFHKLSNNIKFVEFGAVDLKPFEFEMDTSLYFTDLNKSNFKLLGSRGKI
jgi:hypothetical protein